jgi:predicted house-cleaning noncanonical NTP pyrophosphatase (MazG superfamily)
MMRRYDKLVRDRIPDIIRAEGKTAVVRTADAEEYGRRLVEKLREEVEEFARDLNAEELADVLEVVRALCLHHGFDPASVEALRAEKEAARGGFGAKLILEEAG